MIFSQFIKMGLYRYRHKIYFNSIINAPHFISFYYNGHYYCSYDKQIDEIFI
jgi:hypothetical protein